jgi:LmbE family N-acetylglucosaminyl deacetylase
LKSLVISPHPDDEILGCGGTLLRRKAEGVELGWLLVTGISEQSGWPTDQVRQRDSEIAKVGAEVGFAKVFNLRLPTMQLDTLPMSELVAQFSSVFKEFQPDEVFLPHRADAHSDHRVVFDAATACTKWFRYASVRRVLAYETISETEFGLNAGCTFQPNCFVDIGQFLERKLEIMAIYQSELGKFPFPRSTEAIRALAKLRGTTSGFMAAEAFQLLRERE